MKMVKGGEFCEMNGLVITGTIFPLREIHKVTWPSLNGRTENRIDHTMISQEYRSSVMETVVRTWYVTTT